MSYRDILFPILTYPDATPSSALEGAAELAVRLGGAVTALGVAVDLPELHNVLANALVALDDIARAGEAESARIARHHAKAFVAIAADFGVSATARFERAPLHLAAEGICKLARTHDLTLIPVGRTVDGDVCIAEGVLFGAGRPIVVYPEAAKPEPSRAFRAAAIAWDGSRAAARAVADALPALKSAAAVEIVTVVDEKPGVQAGDAGELARHLYAHGIKAGVQEISAARRTADAVLNSYVAEHGVDLLIMGGYGHSRAREVLLGGVTAAMLNAPPCPVLMSH